VRCGAVPKSATWRRGNRRFPVELGGPTFGLPLGGGVQARHRAPLNAAVASGRWSGRPVQHSALAHGSKAPIVPGMTTYPAEISAATRFMAAVNAAVAAANQIGSGCLSRAEEDSVVAHLLEGQPAIATRARLLRDAAPGGDTLEVRSSR
jgi:hypothetical protein